MAYNASYQASDISAVVIDILVGVGAALFAFVALIGLVLLAGWVKKKM